MSGCGLDIGVVLIVGVACVSNVRVVNEIFIGFQRVYCSMYTV